MKRFRPIEKIPAILAVLLAALLLYAGTSTAGTPKTPNMPDTPNMPQTPNAPNTPNTPQAPKKLVYTDHEPFGGMRTRFIKEVFFAAIERESGGRLVVEDHWGGELSISYDALRAVSGGVSADMGTVVPEYAPEDLPLHQMFKGFPTGPVGDGQVRFFRRVYEEMPAFPGELRRANIVNVFFGTGFPVAFFSTKPIGNLEDIRGTRWRTASFWHRDFLQNAGAAPITMPWGDGIFKALQSGDLDGLMVNVDSGFDLDVHKVAPHVLVAKELWLGHVYLVAMNRDTWDGLAGEDREAIGRAADRAYKTLGDAMDRGFETQLKELERSGATVRILEPDELSRWETAIKCRDVQDAWVKDQEKKGLKNAGRIMENVRAVLEEVCGTADRPDAGAFSAQ